MRLLPFPPGYRFPNSVLRSDSASSGPLRPADDLRRRISLSRALVLLFPLVMLAAVSCGEGDTIPIGEWHKGGTVLIRVEEMQRVDELRYPRFAGQAVSGSKFIVGISDVQRLQEVRYEGTGDLAGHYIIRPSVPGNELVALLTNVNNTGEELVSMTVGADSAELWGFQDDQRYPLLEVLPGNRANVIRVEVADASEDLYTPFIAGPTDLPPEHSVTGWLFFDVPEGTELRELVWRGGEDVVHVGVTRSNFRVVPNEADNELLAVRLAVHNAEAAIVVLSMGEKSAEVRGLEFDERYPLLDLFRPEELYDTNVRVVAGTHPLENLYDAFLAGSIDLPQGHSVVGWLVFEVPKNVKLDELRWEGGGDVIFLD